MTAASDVPAAGHVPPAAPDPRPGAPLRLAPAAGRRATGATRLARPVLSPATAEVTLKQVAAQARVHPGTASRALHPATRHLVSEGTARRVLRAAESLGYLRNHTAASLRTRHTRTVGVLLQDLADPLAAMFARGLEDQLATAGYVALTGSTDCSAIRERMILTEMRGRHVDGLILAGRAARAPLVAAASKIGLPLITAGGVPHNSAHPAVSADLPRGARMVVNHLAALGHRAIACLTGPGESGRYRDLLAAMVARGLQPPSQVVAKELTADEGRRCCRSLLMADAPGTAIITTSDTLAAGCCQALAADGRACPGDISVTGFGDLPIADSMTPTLTTIRLPQYHLGIQAAQLLLDRIADPDSPAGSRLLSPELIVRGSTGPATGAQQDDDWPAR
ncbi:MAG TPA: LacI family DNA-binding transcriptional regulator [Streptosporangiaceae bacterium]|nr:LacI family DNA-binding transcriptional regulator [Streptosporangiaceae bacterium]